jgi:hypothetical protein
MEATRQAYGLETKSARSVWMDTQRHHLMNNLHHITGHRWCAASPFGDEEWPLTDHPVLTLNYYERGRYDFEAGWGKKGSEFILPVSPKVALYTRVGDKTTGPFTFSRELTAELQRIMAERSFRWILARRSLPWVAAARPREVNAQRFEQERQFWREWNRAQSQAEAEFLAKRSHLSRIGRDKRRSGDRWLGPFRSPPSCAGRSPAKAIRVAPVDVRSQYIAVVEGTGLWAQQIRGCESPLCKQAGPELFDPVQRHLDLKWRASRLKHQEVLAIRHHGET